LGTLIVEARRHYLDYAEMKAEEASSYGLLLRRLYAALKQVTGAERVYSLVTLEGTPHFHAWLVPRPPGAPERGLAYLGASQSCAEEDVLRVVNALRQVLCAP
jgi:diadenosine tetraphosphate (Ap4A) HIT family hydrolase